MSELFYTRNRNSALKQDIAVLIRFAFTDYFNQASKCHNKSKLS